MVHEDVRLLLHRWVHTIRAHVVLASSPEQLRRIHLRAGRREKAELDTQLLRQRLGLPSRVATGLVEDQEDVPATILRTDVPQEHLEVLGPVADPRQQEPLAGPRVQHAEDGTPRIVACDRHLGLLTYSGPRGAQRRELPQQALIAEEHHRVLRQSTDPLKQRRLFFARSGSFRASTYRGRFQR